MSRSGSRKPLPGPSRVRAEPALAIDLGGTKLLVALVDGGKVLARVEQPTDRSAAPAAWLARIAELARPWSGRYARAGVSVTGPVIDGRWSSLNPGTLSIPADFPLQRSVEDLLGVPVAACNDAQAAAWGEYTHGAGAGQDMVFLTVSTGIGGGIVCNGRLIGGRQGLSGSFGQVRPMLPGDAQQRLEDCASGRWIAAESARRGYAADTRVVFAKAADGADWANAILAVSASTVARLCANIQLMLDPGVIVIGGGVGLAPGYLQRVADALAAHAAPFRTTLKPAALGADAGIIGIAALTQRFITQEE